MSNGERETLDVDVLFVGAGPANLAGGYHLGRKIQHHSPHLEHRDEADGDG